MLRTLDVPQHCVFIWKRIAEVEEIPQVLGSEYSFCLAHK